MGNTKKSFRSKVSAMTLVTFALMALFLLGSLSSAYAQTGSDTAPLSAERAQVQKYGLIAAALAFGFGAIGAGIAIASVGAAAMGAIGERPEIASQALIFIALAEGLVVFGFITALMILGKV